MIKVNIHEAKTHLSSYLRKVKAGETILICERNVPVAELHPLTKSKNEFKNRPLGLDAEKVQLSPDWDSVEINRELETMFGLNEPNHPEF